MWFLRRILQISWIAKKSNEAVLGGVDTMRSLINRMPSIYNYQATFFGYLMRREKLEHLVTTGMVEGKRSSGKQFNLK